MHVLIVDDHLLFAQAIGQILSDSGIGPVDIASSGEEALAAVRTQRPDVALVDVGLTDENGIALGRAILAEAPTTKVVSLTALEDDRAVQDAQRSGLSGYLTKSIEPDEFRSAIERIAAGERIFPRGLGRPDGTNGNRFDRHEIAGHLTTREREVLQLLAEGASSQQISAQLGLSPNTVRTHVQGILSKLQVHSRVEAAAYGVRHGLVRVNT